MKGFHFLFLIPSVFLYSCSSSPTNKAVHQAFYPKTDSIAPKNDTLVMLDPIPLPPSHIDSIDIASILEKKLPLWVKFCKKSDPQFDIHAFKKNTSAGFTPYVYGPSTPLDSMDQDDLKYLWLRSPDSKYVVNIYAYRCMVERHNGKIFIEGGDPEWAIDVMDYRKKKVQRPLMIGSDQSLADVCWIDNYRFLVTGSDAVYGKDTLDVPCFYVYDLEKQRTLTGTWPSHGNWHAVDYLKNYKGPKLGVIWDN
jgi:hypothetical protein